MENQTVNYENKTVKQLEKLSFAYQNKHRNWGGSHESDMSINDISRATIRAFHKQHEGSPIYLVCINPLINGQTSAVRLYNPKKRLYNFSADYVTTYNGSDLINAIEDYRNASIPNKIDKLNAIWDILIPLKDSIVKLNWV